MGETEHTLSRRTFIKITGVAIGAALFPYLAETFIRNTSEERHEIIKPHSVIFGVAPDKNDLTYIDKISRGLGHQVGLVNLFQDWSPDGDLKVEESIKVAIKRGLVPMISWRPSEVLGQTSRLANLSQNESYIREMAGYYKQMGKPILLRPFYEMNGNWFKYYATNDRILEFKTAWFWLYQIFREVGASNVTFVYSPNISLGAAPVSAYYPGNEFVDIVSLDVYDKNGVFSPEQLFASDIAELRKVAPGKPLIFSEFNSMRPQKAQWMYEAINVAVGLGIKAIISFDWNKSGASSDETDWRILANPEVTEMYRKLLQKDWFYRNNSDKPEIQTDILQLLEK